MPEEVVTTPAPVVEPLPVAPPAGKGSAPDSEAATPEGEPKPTVAERGEFARRRHALSEQKKQVRERERQAEARERAADERQKASEARVAALEKQIEALSKGNPLLREGADPEANIRELLAQGTPEAKVIALEKQLAEDRAKREALEQRLDKEAKERTEAEEKRRVEGTAQAEARTLQNFVQLVSVTQKAKYPYLNAEFEAPEILALAREANQQAKSQKWKDPQGKWHTGATYTFDEVANALEAHAKNTYKTRDDRRKALLAGSQEPPATEPRAKAPPGIGRRAPVQAPRVAETPKPRVDVRRRMSREEEQEADLAMLRKATSEDAAARAKRDKPAAH